MGILRSLLNASYYIFMRKPRLPGNSKGEGPLETVLFHWTRKDAFSVRNLLDGGVAILGRTGSGKTSSSGKLLGEAIIRTRRSGGLIIAAKPEDAAMWSRMFEAAGRKDDLLHFSPHHPLRFNFLDYAMRDGAETRNIVHCIQMLGETLQSNDRTGAGQEEFWQRSQERMLYFAVEVIKHATGGKVSAPELQRFIAGAASSPDQLNDPSWTEGLHRRYLEAAFNAPKNETQSHDFQLAADYWLGEYPTIADRTRSSIVTGVMGTLHVFNTGIARTLISSDTNVSPDDTFAGKWVLVNMSAAEWGIAGSFVSAGWKYHMQRAVLRRAAVSNDNINVIWCDEAHQVVNSFDATYLAQCRSHRGTMIFLSQGLPGFYVALKGEAGEHQANALLGCFGHCIVHAADPVTAEWASKKLGKKLESFFGGSCGPAQDVYDELFGVSRFTGSFNEHYEEVLQQGVFINGLRTGGHRNENMCDAIVIRSGEPFANGENWLFRSFTQD